MIMPMATCGSREKPQFCSGLNPDLKDAYYYLAPLLQTRQAGTGNSKSERNLEKKSTTDPNAQVFIGLYEKTNQPAKRLNTGKTCCLNIKDLCDHRNLYAEQIHPQSKAHLKSNEIALLLLRQNSVGIVV